MILPRAFFRRSPLEVAPELLGKFLVAGDLAAMITEVEAYDGPEDLACHASKGRTARTEVMFGDAGFWYVYLIYGMHHMLNVVTGPEGYPSAVLIRGVEAVSGPGRVARHFGVDKRLYGLPAAPGAGLHIEDRGAVTGEINVSARIGIDYAGPWKDKPYRFYI